jgi:hypothetical protein
MWRRRGGDGKKDASICLLSREAKTSHLICICALGVRQTQLAMKTHSSQHSNTNKIWELKCLAGLLVSSFFLALARVSSSVYALA